MSDQWMGSIAAQDQYRPLGNDPWTNTMRGTAPAPGQGFAPVQQSPVLYNTKAGPITEADIENTIGIGMGVSGGGLKTDIVKAPGIKAFHSSPHDFDKFDLAKIGTGEGAQVYGHGLYFAENPAVSGQGGQYWKQFQRRFSGPEELAADYLKTSGFDRAKAIELAKERSEELGSLLSGEVRNEFMQARRLLESDKPVGPRTYEVNIKADPAHMLDWDKPWHQQSARVQEVMGEPRDTIRNLGQVRYKEWAKDFGDPTGAKVSEILKSQGIPGIKYLDQGSRNVTPTIERMHRELAGYRERGNKSAVAALEQQIADAQKAQLSSNYVIFDPSIVDIMKKYGIAGAAPAGMSALAAQDAYRGDR